uniref:Helicase ATP-binding domain-containing protein n=1 Tax=Panagrolaimus davidi TaxID=227884 RepID=A0A914PB45_9BILA
MHNDNIYESRTQNILDGENNDEASTSKNDIDRNQDPIAADDLWDVDKGLQELERLLPANVKKNSVKSNIPFIAACLHIKDEENELKMLSTKLELNETQKEAIKFLMDLVKDDIYDIDYQTIQPPRNKSKSLLNYWDSFKQEYRWIGKEQKNLEKWQRKWARKLAKDCQKKATERGKSDELLKEKEETTAKKGAAKVATIIQEFWKNIAKVAHFYELQLMEDVKQKRLESQLMNVIDRSSTLTQLMIPGSKKTNIQKHNDELKGLGDHDDLDTLLASLPPEYLESLTAQHGNYEEEQVEPERVLSLADVSPKRPSPIKSPNKLATNGFKEVELPLKDTNGFGEKRKKRLSLSPPIAKKSKLDNNDETAEVASNETLDETMNETIQPQTSATSLHDEEMNEIAKVAESFRPTGSTYDTAKVRTEVPSLIFATLRQYQHIGLDWLASLFDNKLNGILADEMGLGKTVQTISFLAHLAENKKIWGPHLIVVPTSVLLNWEREFKRFCPSLKVLTYFGSTKERQEKRKVCLKFY